MFSIPTVQTQIAKYVTNKINEDFGTDLVIKKVDLSFLGSVQLKNIEIRDHHKDTLIFIEKLSTSLQNIKNSINNSVQLKSVSLDGVYYYLKTYKGEKEDSFEIFLNSFEDDKPKDSLTAPFNLKTSNIYLDNFNFKIIDENNQKPIAFEAKKGGGNIQDFSIVGPNVSAKIRGLYFTDNRNIEITNLTTNYHYFKTAMNFQNTILETKNSIIKANIKFTYKREDLKYFNDKVIIKAAFSKSKLSILDLKKLYGELNGNDLLYFKGEIIGTLNNFKVNKFNSYSNKGMKIIGDLNFLNTINTKKGFEFEGDLENVTANYEQLKNVLPNLLGQKLPTEFKRIGNFTLSGITKITEENIIAALSVESDIGTTISDLKLTNIDEIDAAEYNGQIEFIDFDMGVFFNDPLLGLFSFKGDVNGSGFKIENISTSIIGKISKLGFNNYDYQNILVNGQYKNKLFDGSLTIDDPHLKMAFKGLANLSSKIHKFDFKAAITHLNLKETNLFTRDTLSVLKGKINLDISGNTFDDVIGTATFNNISYTNEKEQYKFEKFKVVSEVQNEIKKIEIASKDIVNGTLNGNFTFAELLPISQNALGSIYANYKPHKVNPNQFIDFDFTIYNKIIDVFFPEIYVDKNTKIKGKIKGNKNTLKLLLSSPKITAYGNEIKDVLLRTDNQNSLYNTHLTASQLTTKYYTISKLNLLNRTENDTLFFKSVFKGGVNQREDFNVDFFYTINDEEKSVIGIQKSTIGHKNNIWQLNPDNDNKNKVTFNLRTNEFNFSPFQLTSKEQKIELKGLIKGDKEKTLSADFTKVRLENFLPIIDSLNIKGIVNGNVDFIEKEGIYSPQGTLLIKDFEINNYEQGNLALNIQGNNSYEKYTVDLSVEKSGVKNMAATGFLDFSLTRPTMDLNVFLEDFELNAFSPLGEGILSKIRGKASGDFTFKGFVRNPEMNGNLKLVNAGLQFPYLNVDYDFAGVSSIALQGQSFFLDEVKLKDTKYNTTAKLTGSITHKNFDDWFLKINLSADNLLILDTQDSEESLYYGSGFIKGNASISGLTDQLTINVNAITQPGTLFVLPLKDIQTINNYRLIHFKNENENAKEEELALEAVKGLSLDINLQVTKDAIAQVVIDEINGSELKGSGEGDLLIEIDTRGKFNMSGNFEIDNGIYNLKYGGLINKPFIIQKGGTISWNGNPLDANLNVTALYETKANPAVLLENFNTNRKIPIDLITKISGGLFTSQQEFDIKIPNSNSNIESELDFILNDNDVNNKIKQFFSLLAFGTFVSTDRTSFDSNAVLTGTTSSLIGNVLSDIVSTEDGKFQVGLNYIQGNRNDIENLNTDNLFDVSVTTQISDRIIVNGKVGVPIGTKTQSSVVGEVKVEVLLNEQGNFRGVVFNRQNEIQYATQEEGYTQGVGLSYQVDFNSLSELLQKIRLKKKKEVKKRIKKDSVLTSHKKLLNFKKN